MTTRIDAVLAGRKRPTLSFEFFPPKNEEAAEQLMTAVSELGPLQPDFVSITRTGGGTPPTLDLTARMQNQFGFTAMSHLTCAGYSREQLGGLLDAAWNSGIENVLALRGDAAPGSASFTVAEGGFANATDLVEFVASRHPFCIGVAGYPEGHPQCLNLIRDAEYLKRKVDLGASFVISQLFFRNDDFFRWRDLVVGLGVKVPLIAGIMPIGNLAQIKRFVGLCGARIPHDLLVRLEALESDPEAVQAAGREHAVHQCAQLLQEGVGGLHFYTLNRSHATVHVANQLRQSGLLRNSATAGV